MSEFWYRGIDGNGRSEHGYLQAETRSAAAARLRSKGIYPQAVYARQLSKLLKTELRFGSATIDAGELSEFCREAALLLQSGLPMDRMLYLTAAKRSSAFSALLRRLAQAVEQGLSLAQACRSEEALPPLIWQSLRAAELSDRITEVFEGLALYYQEEHRLRSKLRNALFYPRIVLIFALLITVFIMQFLLPSYLELFQRNGAALPMATAILVKTWEILRIAWPILLLLFIGLRQSLMSRRAANLLHRAALERLLLRLPYLGTYLQAQMLAQLCRTISLLLAAGVSMDRVLLSVERMPRLRFWQEGVRQARSRVLSGMALSAALAASRCFPDELLQLVQIGEVGGRLVPMLENAAHYYASRVETNSEKLLQVVQPLLMLLLAVFIGALTAALLLPLYTQLELVGRISG